ncbi:MAG TPA: hypothetical protein PKC87_00035 [Candidatus Absconditabacterales bacterium]|mgnify:CR=1 FL=1|nr:hypothetical protein [Candidatus Absconditabacterales bacterium]
MGRLKKYLSQEEKIEAQKEWSRSYYWKNKEQIDEKAREKYRQGKQKKRGV